MSEGFSSSGTSQEEGVFTSWGSESELIESQALTTSSDDSLSSLFSESQSADSELGDGQESDVVGNGGDDDDGLIFSTLEVLNNSGNADGISDDSGLVESSEDGLVECRISSSGQELVESDQQLVIRVGSSSGTNISVLSSASSL